MNKSLILGSLFFLTITQQATASEINWSQGPLEYSVSNGGYNVSTTQLTAYLGTLNTESCESSQASRSIQNSAAVTAHFDLEFKRELFLALAEKFAGIKTKQQEDVAKLIQTLALNGKSLDWCAGFASTMANLTDEIAGKVSSIGPNQVHDGSSLDYASANKLLEYFDPDYKAANKAFPHASAKMPVKKKDMFLGPDQQPVPGCIGVYLNPQTQSGHVVIVISANGSTSGHIQTVEGNTPAPGSKVSSTATNGVFSKVRPWGKGQLLEQGLGDVYQGCVLPWPGMAQLPKPSAVSCTKTAASDSLVPQLLQNAQHVFTEAEQVYSQAEKIVASIR